MTQIIITIPDDKVQQFKTAMWLVNPPPEDWVGTDLEWVKSFLVGKLKKAYEIGESRTQDDDIGFS